MLRYKKTILYITVIGLLLLLFFLTGTKTYSVTLHSMAAATEMTQTVILPVWSNAISTSSLTIPENDTYTFSGWYYDQDYTLPADSVMKPENDMDLYAGWFQDNSATDYQLPELYVTADLPISELSRSQYDSCSFTLTNTTVNNCLDNTTGQIKGRGNSTWTEFDKKSYKIKFDEQQDLFQMGAAKTWILLSNSVDYTLMRNEISLALGEIFDLAYTSSCQWIHLFYNDEYRGLYLLCEQIETGINRVNIETPYDYQDLDPGFLLELGGGVGGFSLPEVTGADENWAEYFSCEVLYPEPEQIVKHQEEYIDAYMQLVNTAILTKDWELILELVDIDSFVSWFLVNEIMLNGDMGWSMFAYKPQGEKLHLGPLWDFDQSCGVSGTGGSNYETWYPDTSSQNTWFRSLFEIEEFRTLAARQLTAALPEIELLLTQEQEKSVLYRDDIQANFERWDVLGTTAWRIREEIGTFKTYEENVDFLFTWLHNRIRWMNQELERFL